MDYYGSIQGNVGNLSSVFFNPSLFFTDPGYYFSTFGRLETIFQSHKAITSSYLSTIFGFGLGSKTLTASEVYASHAMAFDRFTALTDLDHRMFEVGYLGLGIYLLFYFKVLSIIKSLKKYITDPYWNSIVTSFKGVIIVYILSIGYTDLSTDILQCFFWVYTSCILGCYYNLNIANKSNPNYI